MSTIGLEDSLQINLGLLHVVAIKNDFSQAGPSKLESMKYRSTDLWEIQQTPETSYR